MCLSETNAHIAALFVGVFDSKLRLHSGHAELRLPHFTRQDTQYS